MKSNSHAPYGCPVCGFTSSNLEEVRDHMIEYVDDPEHQEYFLLEQKRTSD